MSDPIPHAAPAPGASPRQPLPPPQEVARNQGIQIGKAYGSFRADLEESFYYIFETPYTGGVPLWDRMSPDERRRHLANVQAEFNRLPRLPVVPDLASAKALREGFLSGASLGYENARFTYRAVWVACELAKTLIMAKASAPSVTAVGSAFSNRFRDCGAQTAARIIQEMTGQETAAATLIRSFGLPRQSISGYDAAVAYALNWFEGIGIKLSAKPGGFFKGGTPGKYVIFMKGGATGGHVVYGEVTAQGLQVVDNQLGVAWNSLEAAQAKLGMQATSAFRVEGVEIP